MNRPKKEELKNIREIGGIYTIDFTRYIDALEKYVDQLEKAFDKVCGELAHAYPCGINSYGTTWHPDSWKEWCMKDETDSSKIK